MNNVQIIGDYVEGNTIKGVGEYFGGREGPSKFEWLREDKDTGLVFLFGLILHFPTLANIADVNMSIWLISFFFHRVQGICTGVNWNK